MSYAMIGEITLPCLLSPPSAGRSHNAWQLRQGVNRGTEGRSA